ncbi:16S rRNA (guanine(966)-N(2))-methyltransferase RsmD [Bdellovibrionota bacterium FG-1]
MIRLTGGEFRGRSIQTPPERAGHAFLRPTQARLRQALFNSLQFVIPEARVLDLFGGSGALGFEALSRGASFAVFIENAKPAIQLIQKNAVSLGVLDRVQVIDDSVERTNKHMAGRKPFDLILADPPYAAGWEMKLLEQLSWEQLLVPEGYFCLEWGAQKSQVQELPEKTDFLTKVREKKYSDSILTTYQRTSPEDSH